MKSCVGVMFVSRLLASTDNQTKQHTPTMTIIPDFLQPIIKLHLRVLLLWFSDYVYETLRPRFAGHPLLALEALVDWEKLEAACAHYHKQTGQGRPVEHTVRQLVRALLVRYFYNKSLRGAVALIRENIPVKCFVGYGLDSMGLSHMTLHRFETYVLDNHPRLFFDTVLGQVLAAFPEQRFHPHLADTFAVLANAQLETLTGRLRHGAARLLLALHGAKPGWFQQVTLQHGSGQAGLVMADLLGHEGEKLEFLLNKAEKQARLAATVRQVWLLLEQVAALHPRPAQVRTYESFLHDVLEKEVDVTVDETGAVVAVRMYTEKERGSYRPTSATDPDATIRNHGKGKRDNGYNASLLTTTDFIIDIQAATGSEPDAAGIVPLLEAAAEHHDVRPQKLIYDQAAGDGHTIAAVHEASNGQTQLVVKPVQRGKKKDEGRLGPLDCTITEVVDEETGELHPALVCPGGATTTTRYRAGTDTGWSYRIPADACTRCPLLERCRGSAVLPARYRQWYISDHREPLLAALAYSQTDAFKADMKLRPQVERVIAGLVLHNGARHARFRGQAKVAFQLKMCATVYNLKRWLVLLDPKKRRRTPRGSAAQAALRLVAAS